MDHEELPGCADPVTCDQAANMQLFLPLPKCTAELLSTNSCSGEVGYSTLNPHFKVLGDEVILLDVTTMLQQGSSKSHVLP